MHFCSFYEWGSIMNSVQWRTQGCAPLSWSKLFHFNAVFRQKFCKNIGRRTPSGVSTPFWEILDPPLVSSQMIGLADELAIIPNNISAIEFATLCQWKSQQICSIPILRIAFVTQLAKCEQTFTCSVCWLSRVNLVLEYGRRHCCPIR